MMRKEALLLLFAIIIFSSSANAEPFGAELSELIGDVVVVHNGAEVAGAVGLRILPGDSIKVGAGGEAEILYDDGNVTVLDEGTIITIKKLEIGNGDGIKSESIISLAIGRIKNDVTKISNIRTKFEVHTKSAVAGVTGTPPWVVQIIPSRGGKQRTEVDLLGKRGSSGGVSVKSIGVKPVMVKLSPGMRTVVRLGVPPLKPMTISSRRLNLLNRMMPIRTPRKKRENKRKAAEKKVEESKQKDDSAKEDKTSKEDKEKADEKKDGGDDDSKADEKKKSEENNDKEAEKVDESDNTEVAVDGTDSDTAKDGSDDSNKDEAASNTEAEVKTSTDDGSTTSGSDAAIDAGTVDGETAADAGTSSTASDANATDASTSNTIDTTSTTGASPTADTNSNISDAGVGSVGATVTSSTTPKANLPVGDNLMMTKMTGKVSVTQIINPATDTTGTTSVPTLPNQKDVVPTAAPVTVRINIINK